MRFRDVAARNLREIGKTCGIANVFFFFSSRRRHTRFDCDWSSDVCSSDLLAASLRARTVSIGGANPDYPGDQWHAALSRMVTACRAYGLRPIDGPYGDFRSEERRVGKECRSRWSPYH